MSEALKFIGLVIAIICVVLFGALLARAEPMSKKDLNTQIDQTNFLVNRGCSGTLVKEDYVLTAYHCVDAMYDIVDHEKIGDDGKVTKEKIRVARPGAVSQLFFNGPAQVQKNSYFVKIVQTDSKLDLALVKLQAKITNKPITLGCNAPERGDKVYAVGNSYAVLYSTVTAGIVSSTERSYRDLSLAGDLGDLTDDGEHGLTQHSAIIAGGNSGGALLNEAGELVGVNVRGAASGFSFAVPLEDMRKLLRREFGEKLFEHCEKK